MGVWDNYEKRIEVRGSTSRDRAKNLASWGFSSKLPGSLSYFTADIDGKMQDVAIINSDNLNEKFILSMPGEDILLGGIVNWSGAHWIVSEKDFNNELYTKAKLLQCNYLLKWVDERDVIHQQWCNIEDGTKLKRMRKVRNGLAYWKRYVKTTPLIAGTPLEPVKRIGQSAAKLRTGEGSTTIPVAEVEASASKWGALNCIYTAW